MIVANDPLKAISTRETPQSEKADDSQVANSAGGYVFAANDETRVHRFLTLGVDGGTYYIEEQKLAKENAEVILRAARERGEWLVEKIVEISEAGRAPRNTPALFALAAVAGLGNDEAQDAAMLALPRVARVGTHLFQFAEYVEQFRGWGPRLKRGVGQWYVGNHVDRTAYQMTKYRQRGGWSHGDLLRLSHPKTEDPQKNALFSWGIHGDAGVERDLPSPRTVEDLPRIVNGFEAAQKATTVDEWRQLIRDYSLTWEMLPDVALNEPKVWAEFIVNGMPQTALMRQLPKLTRLGVFNDSAIERIVTSQLMDTERLRKARVHPVNVLVAQRTYASGRSLRGDNEWDPRRRIVDALDTAFYNAFGTVEPAGKRTLLALDVSGSMGGFIPGPRDRKGFPTYLPVTCREASAALALVTMATEPETEVVGFTSSNERSARWHDAVLRELALSPRQRLDDAVRSISALPFGGTDCALPMTWALEKRKEFDTFVIYTDNETWAGNIQPHQALRRYRERMGIDAKLIVVAMASNGFTIADPNDRGMLDVVGFDSAVPNLISDFSRGNV